MKQNTYARDEGLSAPPPFLFFGLLVVFALFVVGALAVIAYTSSERLSSLVPYVGLGLIVLVVSSFLGAVIFRRRLPRILPVLLVVFWLIVGIGGTLAVVFAYQNILPPRYQAELITQIPALRAFLPPTPVGGVVPTVAINSEGPSIDELLGLTSETTETPEPASTENIEAPAEITLEANQNNSTQVIVAAPTNTSTTEVTPTHTSIPVEATATLTNTPQTPLATSAPLTDSASVQPSPASLARPASARIFGFTHVQQGWNNCGPANITMALSRYGWRESQDYAASFLKPNREDKNVNPSELVEFVNTQTGVRALTRIGGDMEVIKQLIAQEFPVIIETAYYPEGSDFLGHYHTVVGYDDGLGAFYVYDSYIGTGEGGAGLVVPYQEFDTNWQAFNRVFIVLYERERENTVAQILGDLATPEGAAERALETAQQEARQDPRNSFAWFNLGTAYTRLGDYESAAGAYDRARATGQLPFRMLWYQHGPFEAYFNVGRYDDVEGLVNANLTNGAEYVEETYYWQGRVHMARGDRTAAAQSFQQALIHNTRYEAAQIALDSLNS